MTFEQFWEKSGWARPGEDPEEYGCAEYALAQEAWKAATKQSLPVLDQLEALARDEGRLAQVDNFLCTVGDFKDLGLSELRIEEIEKGLALLSRLHLKQREERKSLIEHQSGI